MKIYQKRFIEKTKVKYVICNNCGENIDVKKYRDFLSINKVWGYNSNYDNEVHHIEICQECYYNFISQLKIKPKITKRKKFICL